MAGDPTPSSITLWTRVGDVEQSGSISLEISRDPGFSNVIASRRLTAGVERDHTVHARVDGLAPHEQYWYRFSTARTDSSVGRFRTALPADSQDPVRFAFFSCQDYTFGYYNAHALIADEDVDFVVNLGDYIYAEAYHRAGSRSGGVRTDPVGEAATLEEYRRKYRVYRSDGALRAMHANHAMISTWDDHEVQDDYAGAAGALGGLPAKREYSVARQRAAYRAFFEHMPTLPVKSRGTRIFRSSRFGANVELLLLDERQYRQNQPCGERLLAEACPELTAPRQFLGAGQKRFLKRRLTESRARWKVVANEVMIMNAIFPGDRYIGLDSWQGYVQDRSEILRHIAGQAIEGVVFVTGDIHTFVVGEVRDRPDGAAVAAEFVAGSVTSQGLGEGIGDVLPNADPFNPQTPPEIINLLRTKNPWVTAVDTDHHGYGIVSATQDELVCTLRRLATVKRRSRETLADITYRVTPGAPAPVAV